MEKDYFVLILYALIVFTCIYYLANTGAIVWLLGGLIFTWLGVKENKKYKLSEKKKKIAALGTLARK